MFKWLDMRGAIALGEEWAAEVMQQLGAGDRSSRRSKPAKPEKMLKQLSVRAATACRQTPLNFLQKAKLGNAFKWKLLDAGLEKAYVDELTDWLMLQLK